MAKNSENTNIIKFAIRNARENWKIELCAKNNADVFLYTIIGGGHEWPGGKKPSILVPKPSQYISYLDLMWNFFIKHSP